MKHAVGSVFNYFDAGLAGQPMRCRNAADFAIWLRGFALACAAARLGIAAPVA